MRHKYPGEERQRLTTQLNTSARTLVLTQDLKEKQYLTLRNVKERALMSEEVQERERNLANLITPLHNKLIKKPSQGRRANTIGITVTVTQYQRQWLGQPLFASCLRNNQPPLAILKTQVNFSERSPRVNITGKLLLSSGLWKGRSTFKKDLGGRDTQLVHRSWLLSQCSWSLQLSKPCQLLSAGARKVLPWLDREPAAAAMLLSAATGKGGLALEVITEFPFPGDSCWLPQQFSPRSAINWCQHGGDMRSPHSRSSCSSKPSLHPAMRPKQTSLGCLSFFLGHVSGTSEVTCGSQNS